MVSVRSTPGNSGWPGKCPSKTGLAIGTVACASMRFASRSRATTRSIISKYSRRIGSWKGPARPERREKGAAASGGLLGGDERVDAGHEVLEHEIFLGRHLALVDLLRPLLERQLDPESLVDREGD